MKRSTVMLGIALSTMGLFPACDMLEGVYDDTLDSAVEEPKTQSIVEEGQYCVDATNYKQWVYINLHTNPITITTSDIDPTTFTETGVPEEWDLAHHRYDAKTNGGAVVMTQYQSIEELETAGLPEGAVWVEDSYSYDGLFFDLSRMLEGIIGYAPGWKNVEGSRWLDLDISVMPPIYTKNSSVAVYRFKDGTYAALQLVDFMSADRYRTKGWMTVNYKYPIVLKER